MEPKLEHFWPIQIVLKWFLSKNGVANIVFLAELLSLSIRMGRNRRDFQDLYFPMHRRQRIWLLHCYDWNFRWWYFSSHWSCSSPCVYLKKKSLKLKKIVKLSKKNYFLGIKKSKTVCFYIPISPITNKENVCWCAVEESFGFKWEANCETTLWASAEKNYN